MRRLTRFLNTWTAVTRIHRYADQQHEWTEENRQAFTELAGDQRWYNLHETAAVDMPKKGMSNYGIKAKKRWLYQNYQAVTTEFKALQQQQEGR